MMGHQVRMRKHNMTRKGYILVVEYDHVSPMIGCRVHDTIEDVRAAYPDSGKRMWAVEACCDDNGNIIHTGGPCDMLIYERED